MKKRAAIYARKSNDDDNKCPDNKSNARQIDRAKEYAESKGFVVSEEHIFSDDGISGAEFKNRPGLSNLRLHASEFDAVIMSEISRLGRDSSRTPLEVIGLREQDVKIFYYLTDEEEKANDATSILMMQIRTFTAEVEREKIAQRVSDALMRKAKKGYVTGGPVYGYDIVAINAKSANGELVKSHSDYRINPSEATVINAIFKMYKDGHGYKKIALALNGDSSKKHVELRANYLDGMTPDPSKKSKSWSFTQVRNILSRDKYNGFVTYGKTKSVYRGGSKKTESKEDYIKASRPDLKIIDDELWNIVQLRRKESADAYSASKGGPLPFSGSVGSTKDSKFLLSSLGSCSECGSSIVSLGGTSGYGNTRKQYYKYGCSGRHNKGDSFCSNDHKVWLDDLDNDFLIAIKSQVLSSEAIEYVIQQAQKIIMDHKSSGPNKLDGISKELSAVVRDIEKLIELSMKVNNSDAIAEKISKKEEDKLWLQYEKERLSSIDKRSAFEPEEIRLALNERMTSFKSLMKDNVSSARKALKALLPKKVIIRPVVRDGKKTLTFEGVTTVGALAALDDDEENHIGLNYSTQRIRTIY